MKNKHALLKKTLNVLQAAALVFTTAFASAQGDSTKWTTNGNQPAGEAFIGTTNNRDLIFKSYGQEYMRLKTDGKLGIKTNAPTAVLDVNGDARFREAVIVKDRIDFGTDYAIKFTPAGTTTPARLTLGPKSGNTIEPELPACWGTIKVPVINQFKGLIQAYGTTPDNRFGLVSMGFDGANGLIDVEGATTDGTTPQLLINYYCGRDVKMCTGPNGGVVTVGSNMEIGNIPRLENAALHIGNGLEKAIVVSNGGVERIQLFSTGRLKMNVDNSTAGLNIFDIHDGSRTNFAVKGNGFLFARRIEVTMNNFPDYVFAGKYKLLTLEELGAFIKTNQHLPGMPTAKDVEASGADLGELTRLNVEKIEELHLYILQLNERLKQLEEENALLKKK